MQASMGPSAAGVVALLVSLLTAGALALHVTYGGSAIATDWSLARLQLSRSAGGNSCAAAESTPADTNATGLPASWAAGQIAHDFRHWRRSGIQKEALDQLASDAAAYQWGEPINAFRFQIISGQLYMDTTGIKYRRTKSGQIRWFPSQSTAPGNMSISGRAPLAMLALKELLLLYPGQVPDVDAFMHFADVPVVQLSKHPAAAPLFSPCSSEEHAEIPWPDWSFWSGKGWEAERAQLLRRNAAEPLEKRTPALIYRGRARVDTDIKRKMVIRCSKQLPADKKKLIDAKSVTWLETKNRVSMEDMCNWRYQIYIEAAGWSASLKYRLACGSVLLQVKPQWAEWFSRGLHPGRHYLEVPAEPLNAICPTVVQTLEAAEAAMAGGHRVGTGASSDGGGGDSGSSNSSLAVDPFAVAAAGTAFVLQQLRMQDVREYMLDLLRTYASLQRFTPQPTASAELITAERLLQHFVTDVDRERILKINPWLRCALEQGT